MAGFDPNSLTDADLNELLEDHKKDLDAYLARKVCRKRPVNRETGTVDRFETPLQMSADLQRSVKHAPGEASPGGNSEMGQVGYRIECYSWKEGVNHLAEQSLSKISEALQNLSGSTAHIVLGALDREFASILLGNGTSDTDDDLTEKAVSNPWDGASATITNDVDDVVKKLRSGSRGLMAVVGYDIALVMSKDSDVINHADKAHTDFPGVRAFLRSRGINEVHIDVGPEQDGEREAARSYKGIFDGVFAIGTADNFILPEMNDLSYDTFEQKDPRRKYFRAAGDWDIVRGYAEHTYYYTGLLT